MDIEKDELPQGWAWATIADVVDTIRPKISPTPDSALPFLGLEHLEPHRLTPSGKGNFSEMKSSAASFKPGDVLYGRLRPYLNKVWCADYAGACSAEFIVMTPPDGVCGKFVKYLLHAQRFVSFASQTTSGDRPRADFDGLKVFEFALPPSREQDRIADKIDELFSDIDEGERGLRKVQALLKKHRQAVLKAAVTGELTREWRQKQPSDMVERCAEISAPFNLPSGWRWLAVREAGEVQLGRQRAPQHHFGPHMRPYLRVANVMDSYIDTSDILEMNFDEREYERYRLEPGDILLNEGQSPDLIGRSAIYNGEVPGACFQKTLLRFRAGAKVQPKFAQMVFRHYMWSGYFRKNSRITTSIGHLTAERFSKLYFPLPVDGEQCQIIDRVEEEMSQIDAMEAVVAAELKRSARLRQSILKAAFTGKLVPQNRADEPAEVLLARLREARATGPASKRGRSQGAPIDNTQPQPLHRRGRPKKVISA